MVNEWPDKALRQAVFVYECTRVGAIAALAPVINPLWNDRDEAFQVQFLDIIAKQMGTERSDSPKALHDTWWQAYIDLGWTYGEVYDLEAKTHPDMVEYEDLGQLEQDKDSIFMLLCEIARLWIR